MAEPEQGPLCIGCGQAFEPGARMCRACLIPAEGSYLPCVIEGAPERIAMPVVCCCCLSREAVPEEFRMDAGVQGSSTVYVTMTVPWCRGCHWRQWSFEKLSWAGFALSVGAVIWGASTYGPDSPGGWRALLYFVAGLAGVIALSGLIVMILTALPFFRLRGHVAACGAMSALSRPDKPVTLVFRNRAFARQFCTLNQLPLPTQAE